MTGDPGWKRNAWPIRLSPNTSTQLSRDSSCSWTRKKKSTQGNDASLISPFSFSFPLQNSCDPFEKNTRVAILAIWFQEKRKEETIQSWRRDERAIFRKRKIRSNRGRIYELGKKIANRTIFPRDPSSFENTNFEATIKIAWNGHALRSSSFKRIQRGEEEGEEKKERRRRRKRREKTKRKKKKKKEMKKGRGRRDNRYLNG